jgi:twitching motility two-component system response regulator PilH
MTKIMIIDDSPAELKMMETILKSKFYTVIPVLNGEGAEDQIAADKPDLILLDVVMPKRNGYEILRSLKRGVISKTIPVVMVSSKSEDTDIAWGKRQGAVDYVVKPYTAESVLATVARVL